MSWQVGMSTDLARLTIHEAADLLASGGASSVELTQAVLDQIDAADAQTRAFVTVTGELALEQARAADARIAAGDAGPLTGTPMQLKDNMCTRGVRTTCSSRMLEGFVPTYDATAARRLYDEGAALVGKGNLDEFAMGSSTENSAFFPTCNPWDLDRVPGGSSGGPAAAVAADECIYALGSDTGGSIRQPAALCGVVGLKPTYGLVSRYGLIAFASSLDQIGPITKDVTDAAIVLNAIAGYDRRDSTSLDLAPRDYTLALTGDVKGLRVGVPKEYFVEGIQPGVERAVRDAITVFRGPGRRRRGDLAASLAVRHGRVLHHRPVGGVGEPGPLRRGEVWVLGARRGQHVGRPGEDAAAGIRAGGQAAHHARDLRAVCWLLRRLLP